MPGNASVTILFASEASYPTSKLHLNTSDTFGYISIHWIHLNKSDTFEYICVHLDILTIFVICILHHLEYILQRILHPFFFFKQATFYAHTFCFQLRHSILFWVSFEVRYRSTTTCQAKLEVCSVAVFAIRESSGIYLFRSQKS